MKSAESKWASLEPFFSVIEKGLSGSVDGGQYFDYFTDDAVMEFPYAPAGTPERLNGREEIRKSFSGYGHILFLEWAGDLIVHKVNDAKTIILEYSGKGYGVKTKRPYNQRYVSVITIVDRKIVHWRDYWNIMESLAAIGGKDDLFEAMYKDL